MIRKRKKQNRPTHRIFIRVIQEGGQIRFTPDRRRIIPTEWVEVKEINLGSLANPNKQVLEVKFVPIEYEDKDY